MRPTEPTKTLTDAHTHRDDSTGLAARSRTRGASILLATALLAGTVAAAPTTLRYQGVLRDATNAPVDGTVDAVFRLFDASEGGNEVLIDRHLLVSGQGIVVSQGLFAASIGGGELQDGSGPGTYPDLAEAFAGHDRLWLEVQIEAEVLSPRTEIHSAGFALNAATLDGRRPDAFLDTSAAPQTKQGTLAIVNEAAGESAALQVDSTELGLTVQTAETSLSLGDGPYGMNVTGGHTGARFYNANTAAEAVLSTGSYGLVATGDIGGRFAASDQASVAHLGYSSIGVYASGELQGGLFTHLGGTSEAALASSGYGIRGRGETMGGYFYDSSDTGYAYLGYGDVGVEGVGHEMGGYFADGNNSGYARVGYANYGIEALGATTGGLFSDSNSSGQAWAGNGDYGIRGYGDTMGGFFLDTNGSGYAEVGYSGTGIVARGDNAGGYFVDRTSGTWTHTAYSGSSTRGSGAKNFVQNHPHDPSLHVVYAAIEGDEVATYTRGRGKLVDGEARIALGETFRLVTNPDLGLTAHLTPRGELVTLAVERVSTEELVVRGPKGSQAAFDYLVQGLRIGFEDVPVLREKPEGLEAYLPRLEEAWKANGRASELESTTPRSRFAAMRETVDPGRTVDTSAEEALVAAIGRFDPDLHLDEPALAEALAQTRGKATETSGRPEAFVAAEERAPSNRRSSAERDANSPVSAVPPVSPGATVVNPEATAFAVQTGVGTGDLVSLDPEDPETLARAEASTARTIVGVVVRPTPGDGTGRADVLTVGVARLNVDAGYGAIRPGDLLTASPTPGHAMRAHEALPGTIVGKALGSREFGTGPVRVLLMPR